MLEALKKFEYVLNVALILMLALVVLLATIDLGWVILRDMLTPRSSGRRRCYRPTAISRSDSR